ncbi:radical SAM protein [candidate division TA06 bacterium]|nr:radical SAM protein [candidate division TA06 bacterium]
MNLLPAQILYRLFRATGWPKVLPFNYTISLTTRCNYRCATCRIWEDPVPELTVEDYTKIFKSLGCSPYWVTFSGGEPFLRDNLETIVDLFCRTCRPKIVNIPTNGSLPDRIRDVVKILAHEHKGIRFIVNVSIDSVGPKQDHIRGSAGAYARAVETIKLLKEANLPNLTVGIGTVISAQNADSFAFDRKTLLSLNTDSLVAEIAEERVELKNQNISITPTPKQYKSAADVLISETAENRKRGTAGLVQAFRKHYYQYVSRVLSGAAGLKCYAGTASVQIMPDGKVWACCIKGDEMGSLKDFDYNFRKLWRSPKADAVRELIKNRACACPLANAAYTNMMLDLRTSLKVLRDLLF